MWRSPSAGAARLGAYVRLDARGGWSSAGSTQSARGAAASPSVADSLGLEVAPSPRKRPAAATTAAGDRKRLARAERRAAAVAAPPVLAGDVPLPLATGPTRVEQASVSDATRDKYSEAFEEFHAWTVRNKNSVLKMKGNPDLIDQLTVSYLDDLFARGESTNTARTALFAIIYKLSLGKGANVLPRSRRAIKGFMKDEPDVSEDPMPIEVMAKIAEYLAAKPDLLSNLAAVAVAIQYDLFTRPTETLMIS